MVLTDVKASYCKTPWLPMAVALLGIGLVLHIIGFATPAWYMGNTRTNILSEPTREVKSRRYGGLWLDCGEATTTFIEFDGVETNSACIDPDILRGESIHARIAVRAITILGALAGLVALTAAILLLLGQTDHIQHLPLIAASASVAAFGFILFGVITWGLEIHEGRFGYSLVLVLVGQSLMAAGGNLAYIAGNYWTGHTAQEDNAPLESYQEQSSTPDGNDQDPSPVALLFSDRSPSVVATPEPPPLQSEKQPRGGPRRASSKGSRVSSSKGSRVSRGSRIN